MEFCERLKKARENANITQAELAKLTSISSRMIQKYESGISRPRLDAAEKLANALNIPVTYLLNDNELVVAQANEKYGTRGAKQAEQLMAEVTGLFAGGEMAEEDMDIMMKAIQDAYWIAKDKNKKFAPKKNSKEN